MGREGEHPGITGKDPGRGIPLVHIEIHHQQPLHQTLVQQHLGGNGDVIEDAEAAAVVGEGVVGPPRQMAGQTMLQRQPCCHHRAAHGQPGASDQRMCCRQADTTLGLAIQLTSGEGLVIGAWMHQFQPTPGAGQWLVKLLGPCQRARLEAFPQQFEFGHREAMARGQRSAVKRVVNEGDPQVQSWVGTRRVRLRSLRRALSSTWRTRSRETSIRRPISARV